MFQFESEINTIVELERFNDANEIKKQSAKFSLTRGRPIFLFYSDLQLIV